MQEHARNCLTGRGNYRTIIFVDAVIVGHICIDLTPGLTLHRPVERVSALIRPGALVDVAGLTVSPGGAVANTGLSLRRMGIETGLIGRVGADPLAAILQRELVVALTGDETHTAAAGNWLQLVTDSSAGTSYSIILPIPGLDRIFLHDSGANDHFSVTDFISGLDRMIDTNHQVTRGAPSSLPRLMHFGYPTAVASMYRNGGLPLSNMLSAARAKGMTVSLDFSLPDPDGEAAAADWREILTAAMPLTDICFPSVEELSLMIDPLGFHERERLGSGSEAFSPEYAYDLAGELLRMRAGVVVVKLGARGLLMRWNPNALDRLHDTGAINFAKCLPQATSSATSVDALLVPSYPVDHVVAATGAGDAAIAGFLAALLSGGTMVDAAETGCVAGRNAVLTIDAVSGAQSLSEMNEFRRQNTHRSPIVFEDDDAWLRRSDGTYEHQG